MSDELPTQRQLEVLQRFRVPTAHMTKETAQAVLGEMSRNEWRRPSDARLAELVVGETLDEDFGDIDDHG
jgi:hypothetical protein